MKLRVPHLISELIKIGTTVERYSIPKLKKKDIVGYIQIYL